jgi:tetrahydromethanopterin:alpha-L-glutamate ligase
MRESAAGRALVLKPLFGSQGKGLQLVGRVDGVHHPLPRLEAGLWRPRLPAALRAAG